MPLLSIILGLIYSGVRISLNLYYNSSLEGPIKRYFKNRRIRKDIEDRVQELCEARFDEGYEFSKYVEELDIDEDLLKQAMQKRAIEIRKFSSFKLWNKHINHLKNYLHNFIEIYNIELEQLYDQTLTDEAKDFWNDIVNEIENVLLKCKPDELVVKNFKTLQKMEEKLNFLVDSLSKQGNDSELQVIYNKQISQTLTKVKTLAEFKDDTINDIKVLQSQIEDYQYSEFTECVSDVKDLIEKGFNYLYTNLEEISKSSEPLLVEILDHLSSQSQSLSVIIRKFQEDFNELKKGIDEIKRGIKTSSVIYPERSYPFRQVRTYQCEECNSKFPDEFIAILKEEGEYECPSCNAIFPGLKVFLSGTSQISYIYEYIKEPLERCGYEIIWYKEEFHAVSNNALEDCFHNLKLADRVVLVIGTDPGEQYLDTDHTITEEEFNRALENDKRIIVFIENAIYKNKSQIDPLVLNFVQRVEELNVWHMSFEKSKQIASQIIKKWGCFIPSKKREIRIPRPQKPPEIFDISSYNEFCELLTMPGFLERPFKDEDEWEIKKNDLFYFGEQEEIEEEFQTTLEKLKSPGIPISLITGKANAGKSTYLLYVVNECIVRNIYSLIIFINPFIEAEELNGEDGILNSLEVLMETQFRKFEKTKILLVVDGLRRRETDKNYLQKSETLFDWVADNNYTLITTLRGDQRDFLKQNFKEKPIDKWLKLNLDEGEIKKHSLNFNQIKKVIIRYLEFSPYNTIKMPFPIESSEFNECVKIIATKAGNIIGNISFIIEDIYSSSKIFSKETLSEYPQGILDLRWNTIRRDYYLEDDRVLPAIFLFLTYQNYSITKTFIYEFIQWGLDNLNKVSIDKQQIVNRVDNLLNHYCTTTSFEDVEEFRLRWGWREALDEVILKEETPNEATPLMLKFREIFNTGRFTNWFTRFIKFFQQKLRRGDLPYYEIETWYIVGDLAKIWGINIQKQKIDFKVRTKLDTLKNASNYLINSIDSHPEILDFTIPLEFLKKTFSLIWKRALKHIDHSDFGQYLEAASHFYKKMKILFPEDYWVSWILGTIYEKKGNYYRALENYVESAHAQNKSIGYGSLISKLQSFQLASVHPDSIKFEFLDLREKAAMKAIECYAYNQKNWSDLAESQVYKGMLFSDQEKFGKAIMYFENGVKAYERAISIVEKLKPKQASKDKIRFYTQIAVNLGKRANAYYCLGKLEKAKKDIERSIEIKQLPGMEENLDRDYKALH